MDKIKGYIDHLIFRNSDNGLHGYGCEPRRRRTDLCGYLPVITEGELIKRPGTIPNMQFGTQFQIQKLEIKDPEDTAAIGTLSLGSGVIKGVGITGSQGIVRKFKEDTFRIMEEEPERLAEVKGISEKKAREDLRTGIRKKRYAKSDDLLQQYGISIHLEPRFISSTEQDCML